MTSVPTSTETRRAVLRTLLCEGFQSVKLLVNPAVLTEVDPGHGIPQRVLQNYPEGVPLDLNPSWPLELDLDGDPDALLVSLSFAGEVCRCRILWRAIMMIGVGVGGVNWEHDEPPMPPEGSDEGSRHLAVAKERPSHLRLVE